MRSPCHQNFRVKDLEFAIIPAIMTKQYSVAKITPKDAPNTPTMPAGAAFWARFPVRLTPS
jgi:hemolysin-activating ACP:hemolysin acyltransferase